MDTIRPATKQEKVISAIAQFLGVSEDEIKPDSKLNEIDPGHDSISDVELVMELEDAFQIDIDDADAERIANGPVKGYIDYIVGREDAK